MKSYWTFLSGFFLGYGVLSAIVGAWVAVSISSVAFVFCSLLAFYLSGVRIVKE